MPTARVPTSAKVRTALVKAGYLPPEDADDVAAVGAAASRLLKDMTAGRVAVIPHRGGPKKTVAAALAALLDDYADSVLKMNN
jgi:hypothetical protein